MKFLCLVAMVTAAFALSSCGGNAEMQDKLHSGPPAVSESADLIASFMGPRNNYTVTRTVTGFVVKDNVSGATTNLHTQTSIKFSDVTVNLLVGDKSKTIPASDLKMLIELYVAFFNRVPDADGMNYWIGEIKAGMTLDQLASSFYTAALQFSNVTGYSSTMTNEEFVLLIYKNVLGRSAMTIPADADGVAYWTEEIRSGRSTRGALIRSMLDSAHNFAGDPVWGWVPQLLDNKVSVGHYFSIQHGLNYNSSEESISKGILIAQAITSSDVLAAIVKIGLSDAQFDLTTSIGTPDVGSSQVVSFIAGQIGGVGNVDGSAANARIKWPDGIAIDSFGNTFVADTYNHTIRKVTPAGVVTTYAGTPGKAGFTDGPSALSQFNYPRGIAVDSLGIVYVGDSMNSVIRKISTNGIVSTFAGVAGTQGKKDGVAQAANFSAPFGLAVDSADNIYVADAGNHNVRKISPTGAVSTISALDTLLSPKGACAQSNGIPLYVSESPSAVYVNANGSLYVADSSNHRVVFLQANGTVGSLNTFGVTMCVPSGIAGDSLGNIFVTDPYRSNIVKIRSNGQLDSFTGAAEIWQGGKGDLDSSANQKFSDPTGIAVYKDNSLLVVDNSVIQKVTSEGVATTFVGSRAAFGYSDGIGSLAKFDFLSDIVSDNAGFLFVTDYWNHTIRKINASTGAVSTFAGKQGVSGTSDGLGIDAKLDSPSNIAIDANGNIFVADDKNYTIRKITPSGIVTTFAGKAGVSKTVDGIGSEALFGSVSGLAVGKDGYLYVADKENIRKISPFAQVTTMYIGRPLPALATPSNSIGQIDKLVVDSKNNIYFNDLYYNHIKKIDPNGVVSILAGSDVGREGYQDGAGTAARFKWDLHLALDRDDNLLVADRVNDTIRKITPDGKVTTIVGTLGKATINPFSLSIISGPRGLTMDKSGRLFVILDQAVFQIRL